MDSKLQAIFEAFKDSPRVHAVELDKYRNGFADDVPIADELLEHTYGTYFGDCVLLSAFASQTTMLIAHCSLLYLICYEESGHYEQGSREQLVDLLNFQCSREGHLSLCYFLFTADQIALTVKLLRLLEHHQDERIRKYVVKSIELFTRLYKKGMYFFPGYSGFTQQIGDTGFDDDLTDSAR